MKAITFTGVSEHDEVIFNEVKPRIVLSDFMKIDFNAIDFKVDIIQIMQPVVKLENCTWLQEF